ncbi:gluconokinase [Sphingobium limneticum]|uniref:Gluconokinase n=2 Tax=Sphingomonadaceae TaxID=41297 RepID=A0A5J5IEF0_9SPHN|nr:gluconokinase [Sphingobium limneticum]KAA9021522.1 gluconokinase [Sphingobium limneticum]KAA9033884.1 gluconokinase [Sphingobium limneticum]
MPSSANPARSQSLAVIVMGVSGCGKSTLGALLADALACPFLEGDSFHSPHAIAKMRGGQPLTDEDRWPWLDRLGSATATASETYGAAVAACSALRESYRDRLRSTIGDHVRFVLLDNSREQLLARLGNRPGHYMPATLLDSQIATLERPEPDARTMILTTDIAPEALRDRVMAWLR